VVTGARKIILVFVMFGLQLMMGCGSNLLPLPLEIGGSRYPLERGGSNYPMYSVGQYLSSPTEETWYAPGNMRPVIGTFHLAPDIVRQQLHTMYTNGQRRIALSLWFADFSSHKTIRNGEVYGHMVNSQYGRLLPRHEANLKSVLQLIQQIGYEEVVFRFGSQGNSAPWGWRQWEEDHYQKNLSFIISTRAIVEDVLGHTPVKVTYDLDGELGGRQKGQSRRYLVRLWRDYTARFGATRTFGFSVAAAPGRFAQLITDLDQAGLRPAEYAADMYGNEFRHLSHIERELQDAHEGGKPLVILETFYNDATTAAQIDEACRTWKNIRTLFQWPLARDASHPRFSVHYPPNFDNYLPLFE